ncbi:MAG: hypothetical protein ACFFDF_07795, partial [Candidatus Odinarchaeota archaeon]
LNLAEKPGDLFYFAPDSIVGELVTGSIRTLFYLFTHSNEERWRELTVKKPELLIFEREQQYFYFGMTAGRTVTTDALEAAWMYPLGQWFYDFVYDAKLFNEPIDGGVYPIHAVLRAIGIISQEFDFIGCQELVYDPVKKEMHKFGDWVYPQDMNKMVSVIGTLGNSEDMWVVDEDGIARRIFRPDEITCYWDPHTEEYKVDDMISLHKITELLDNPATTFERQVYYLRKLRSITEGVEGKLKECMAKWIEGGNDAQYQDMIHQLKLGVIQQVEEFTIGEKVGYNDMFPKTKESIIACFVYVKKMYEYLAMKEDQIKDKKLFSPASFQKYADEEISKQA